jgi:hypothetical protein
MSNRRDEFKSGSTNPATRFLEWDSNAKGFKFYDKEKKENIPVKVPFKFLVLKSLHTVKGWHSKSESGIYSNEINNMNEMLNVKSFKGGHIVSGIYREIKEKLQGGVYFKSIYIMLGDGSIANIALKGASCAMWGDFTKKTSARLADEWVVVTGAEDQKNGSVKYSVPVFEFKGSLTEADAIKADEAYDVLSEYFKDYMARKVEEAPSADELLEAEETIPNKAAHVEPAKKAPATQIIEDEYELPF